MSHTGYCFVLMPFGKRRDPSGGPDIDFDRLFRDVLSPAIRDAGLRPHRDDLVANGGLVQKGIYEALLLCEYAIADLTTGNPNVLYELGIRHAVRPSSTLTITARPDAIPFDVRDLRCVQYRLDANNALPDDEALILRTVVAGELNDLRQHVKKHPTFMDSPLYQLIEGWRPAHPETLKTDLFARRVLYNEDLKLRLAAVRDARASGTSDQAQAVEQIRRLESELGDLEQAEAGVLVDVLLTYRAVEAWDEMVRLAQLMPGFIGERALVKEQLALALNRRSIGDDSNDSARALSILYDLDKSGRAGAETWGIVGRVWKDRWRTAHKPLIRSRHLDQAISAYTRGFNLDPRDPYCGINAATLIRIRSAGNVERDLARLVPVVEFAATRMAAVEKPSYWLEATLLETAVLRGDRSGAVENLARASALIQEVWQPKTTAQNLRDIARSFDGSTIDVVWIDDLVHALEASVE